MYCSKCHEDLVKGAKFCMVCGAKVPKRCSKCGMELPDIARFCFECGTEVSIDDKKTLSNTAEEVKKAILDEDVMKGLLEFKKKVEPANIGVPVWDTTSSGNTCDCAVGECDCDGSIWN